MIYSSFCSFFFPILLPISLLLLASFSLALALIRFACIRRRRRRRRVHCRFVVLYGVSWAPDHLLHLLFPFFYLKQHQKRLCFTSKLYGLSLWAYSFSILFGSLWVRWNFRCVFTTCNALSSLLYRFSRLSACLYSFTDSMNTPY